MFIKNKSFRFIKLLIEYFNYFKVSIGYFFINFIKTIFLIEDDLTHTVLILTRDYINYLDLPKMLPFYFDSFRHFNLNK